MNPIYEPYIGKKLFPAISITIPISLNYPEIINDEEKLISILNDVGYRLRKLLGNGKADLIMKQITDLKAHIPVLQTAKTLIIYLSPYFSKIIPLPYRLSEKIIVDDTFEIRDLVYSSQKNQNYFLLMINANGIKTMIGNNIQYLGVKIPDMPGNIHDVYNEHSFPGVRYTDKMAFKEKNMHKYVQLVDKIIEDEIVNLTDFPIIIMGNTEIISDFKLHTHYNNRIIGFVEGSFEHSNTVEIKKAVTNALNKNEKEKQEKAIELLEKENDQQHIELGLQNVWRAAAEGKGRILLVETDYRAFAIFGEDEYSILPVMENYDSNEIIQDAVDDIIENILKFDGEVIFIDNGKLSNYDRIALITRY